MSLPTGDTLDPLLYNLCIPSYLILITLYETGIIVIPNSEMRKLKHSERDILLRITKLQKEFSWDPIPDGLAQELTLFI